MDIFNSLENIIEKTLKNNKNKEINIKETDNITKEEIDLANKLDAIEEFTIDKFEDDIVVLENRDTRQIVNINKDELPNDIKEGDILKKINGKYFIDKDLKQETADRIKKKMDDLWN